MFAFSPFEKLKSFAIIGHLSIAFFIENFDVLSNVNKRINALKNIKFFLSCAVQYFQQIWIKFLSLKLVRWPSSKNHSLQWIDDLFILMKSSKDKDFNFYFFPSSLYFLYSKKLYCQIFPSQSGWKKPL